MPIENPGIVTDRHRLVRGVAASAGTVEFEARIARGSTTAAQRHRRT